MLKQHKQPNPPDLDIQWTEIIGIKQNEMS
mgnify:CR=1 FL=1